MVITTSSVVDARGGLEIVQRRVATPETANPVTPDVGEDGVVIVTVPETTDQSPVVPAVGVFPAKVAIVTPQLGLISAPAFAATGGEITVTDAVFTDIAEPQALLTAKV